MIEFLWLLSGLAVLTLLLHALARLLYVPVTSRTFRGAVWLPARWHEPLDEGEEVAFQGQGGARLGGTYLAATAPVRLGVVGYCHELNGDRWNALPYVAELRRAGFDVFTFDFRNHGESDRVPGYEPTPWVTSYEMADVRSAVEYVCSRPGVAPDGLGLIGVGKGAAAAICAAAEEPRIRALVADGISAAEGPSLHSGRLICGKKRGPVRWLIRLLDVPVDLTAAWGRLIVGWWRGCRFVSLEQAARRLRQPLLVIHGECDSEVPVETTEQLLDCIPADVEFWSVPRARHNGAIDVAPDEYHRRVAQFFREHLVGGRAVEAAPAAVRVDRAQASASPAASETPVAVPVG